MSVISMLDCEGKSLRPFWYQCMVDDGDPADVLHSMTVSFVSRVLKTADVWLNVTDFTGTEAVLFNSNTNKRDMVLIIHDSTNGRQYNLLTHPDLNFLFYFIIPYFIGPRP